MLCMMRCEDGVLDLNTHRAAFGGVVTYIITRPTVDLRISGLWLSRRNTAEKETK